MQHVMTYTILHMRHILYRLKLKLADILDGGDENKEARERKKAARKKRSSNAKPTSVSIGPRMFDDDDDDLWDAMETSKYTSKSKWFKQYINKYTITMDIKVT